MHEILRSLPPGSLVLDLGCANTSFSRQATAASVVRFDRAAPRGDTDELFVQGDAAQLPFAAGSFDAIIANHSLEHFENLGDCLQEIARVASANGALFVAVPDASTLTDKLYRWLGRGGGHVNAFTSAGSLAESIERATGMKLIATRTLCSSLSFLNRQNSPRPIPLRLWPLGAGYEWSLFLYTWISRRWDRWFGTRTSVYGWALYFGDVGGSIDTQTWQNVCIRCGSGFPANSLRVRFVGLRIFDCPRCGAVNPYSRD